MRWAEQQRIKFIVDHVAQYGWIGRAPIIKEFGVSEAQAALDLRTYQHLHEGEVVYNKSAKRYEAVAGQAGSIS